MVPRWWPNRRVRSDPPGFPDARTTALTCGDELLRTSADAHQPPGSVEVGDFEPLSFRCPRGGIVDIERDVAPLNGVRIAEL